MADAYKKLYQGQMGVAAATLYTVPAATSTIVKHMVAVNTGTISTLFKLWRGGTADVNVIFPPITIPAGGGAEWDGTMALNTGETLSGLAGLASSVSLTIDGDEIT